MPTSLLTSDGPALICYDGSEGSKRAIDLAADLLSMRRLSS